MGSPGETRPASGEGDCRRDGPGHPFHGFCTAALDRSPERQDPHMECAGFSIGPGIPQPDPCVLERQYPPKNLGVPGGNGTGSPAPRAAGWVNEGHRCYPARTPGWISAARAAGLFYTVRKDGKDWDETASWRVSRKCLLRVVSRTHPDM